MFIYLLQSSLCCALFYLVYILFFKAHTSYQFNRFYLLLSMLLSALIPWIEITTGVETVYLIPPTNNIAAQVNLIQETPGFTFVEIIKALYFGGVLVGIGIFLFKLIKLRMIIRRGEKRLIEGNKTVIVNEDIGICSFLNYIIIPKSLENDTNDLEFLHEKSHLTQRHSLDIILAWVYQSVFWFNPIAYLYKRRLMEVHEFLADKAAIDAIGKSTYQDYIIHVISQKTRPQLVHNFKSIIKTRLIMMNSKSKPNKWSYPAAVAVFFFSVLSFSCQAQIITKTADSEAPEPWLIETIVDTIIVIDYDTYEESVSIKKIDLQYRLDTMIVLDTDTFEETVNIKKTYSDKSKKILEERSKF